MNFPNGTTEHPINKSSKCNILVSVWDFGAVYPQGERSYYLCNNHPAKMRPSLARAVLQLYGESPVFDPMAGIGTTLVEATLLGMDAVGVEYEKKFVDQANRNIGYVKKLFPNKDLGEAICIKGDARNLSYLSNQKVSSILFSPPFGEANRGSGIAKEGYEGKHGKDEGLKDRCDRPLSKDKNNISNVRYGRTYLGEMLKVYSECFRVLKSGKFMVVVVKDIRRKGLTIPIGCDTIKLLQLAGFELFDIIVNKMYFPSFWQLNHAQKMQAKGIPMTLRTHEYVIVAKKPHKRK